MASVRQIALLFQHLVDEEQLVPIRIDGLVEGNADVGEERRMVGPPGLEPGTSRLKVACSTN